MALMSRIHPAPADPLLGLMLAARADTRPGKVDLGVGIYRDASGATPVLGAVKAAEAEILQTEATKAYEGPRGNPAFGDKISTLILGDTKGHHVAFATPGGCGALFIGFGLARLLSPAAKLYLSAPSWPNHQGIAEGLGIPVRFFPYVAQADGTPDLDRLLAGLSALGPGDIILLQGACHNPTGTDLSADQWSALARLVVERGALPLVDIAYQGFRAGLEEDVTPVRAFLEAVPEAIIAYSCSKNFGLYRERCGALLLQAPSAGALDAVVSQTAALVRASYSMPPSHGPAIVSTILDSEELVAQWTDELAGMRMRLQDLRRGFADALVRASNDDRFAVLARQSGMFSMLPLTASGIAALRDDHGIYVPGSGRINVAGLPEERLDEIAALVAPHLTPAG